MVFCPSCGHKHPDEAQFCMKCGSDVSASKDSQSAESQSANTEDSLTPKPSQKQVAPGPKKGHTLRNVLIVILVLAVIGTIIGAVQGDKDSGEATEATAASVASNTAGQTPTTQAPQPLYLGDVTEGCGCLLFAVTLEDPATPGVLYDAQSGKRLVAVEVIVGNVSAATLEVNPLNATLIDSGGFTYQPELAGRDGQIGLVGLAPGEKVRGWIAFEVDDSATPARIKYALDYFGGEVLQAELEAPPEGHAADLGALSVLPSVPDGELGDVVDKNGYALSATDVENPTTPTRLYDKRAGWKLVAVQLVVANVSGDTLGTNPLYALLVDAEGYVYEPELAGRDDQLAMVDLNPGEKVQGWVAFEIPETASPASIKYLVEYGDWANAPNAPLAR